jgi:FkbM family methyltransferase
MSRERAQALLCEHLGPFGKIDFPYVQMGNIDSLHLFGDTELMILAMYWHNRNRWKNCLDIGANLGLHSICMARMGMSVQAFEPDPGHYELLVRNLQVNHVDHLVEPRMAAVHIRDGTANFVRVLNNLTGNHLEGYKASYGPRETIEVAIVDCRSLWDQADFAKIDCEGNEAEILQTLTHKDMEHLQLVVEVRNELAAIAIWHHFEGLRVPMWSQKRGWDRVYGMEDMPTANRQGSLFIGHENPWAWEGM